MKRIFKFVLDLQDEVTREIHAGARFLSVDEQQGSIVAYFMINEGVPMELNRFRIVGTGQPCDDVASMNFLGTVKMAGGRLMFHVFHDPNPVEVRP